ncbi:MAG: hypothetical protein AAF846_20530 [Chloroflexota bacterium]
MFEIILITLGIIGIILLIPVLLWHFLLGGNLRSAITKFFNTLHGKDLRFDPEADILPSEHQPISDVMTQEAQQFKQSHPLPLTPQQQTGLEQASIQATTVSPQSIYEPPYQETPDTMDVMNQAQITQTQQSASVIEEPVQPLVEDNSFATNDPIIDNEYIDPDTPSADTLEANIPKSDSSPYGVRSAEHSPGRRLRDKRYRRNASS